MSFPWLETDVPYLTTEQMIEVDRAMIEDFEIDLVRMMENAGRNLAHLSRERFLAGDPEGKTVVVLAGTGGNGGGALVCARRLHGYGADVRVAITSEDMTAVPGQQLRILDNLDIPILVHDLPYADAQLIVDGIIGYSLEGAPRDRAAELIRWANDGRAPILSLDTPSGLDATTGTVFDPAIVATATLALALPKAGLRLPDAAWNVGELYLGDISVPPQLYRSEPLNLDVGPIFAGSDVVRLA
jgi:NAD(P)H-hydrate epimerase